MWDPRRTVKGEAPPVRPQEADTGFYPLSGKFDFEAAEAATSAPGDDAFARQIDTLEAYHRRASAEYGSGN